MIKAGQLLTSFLFAHFHQLISNSNKKQMLLKFICNFRILEIIHASEVELSQLTILSTAKWTSFNGKVREKKSKSYMHNYRYLPGGFWHKCLALNKIGYNVKIENISEFARQISIDDFNDWIDTLELDKNPRWYQRKGAWLAIKYRISRGEFATSAGKSLILYLVSRYLLEFILKPERKILIVVPSVMLVKQLAKDYSDYQTDDFVQVDQIYGGSKRNKLGRVVVGNIDALINYDLDFFEQFDAIQYDEAHKLKTSQYQKVIEFMNDSMLELIYSVSGTFYDAEAAEDFPAESISGPILIRVPASDLIEEGSITPIKILIVKMMHSYSVSEQYYSHEDCQSQMKRNHFEMTYIRSISKRFTTIASIASNLEYNQLMLFKSVAYCKLFQTYLEKKCPNKTILTITGDVDNFERDRIKQFTEDNMNVIICATYGTMSTGVSINNLSTMHLVEGSKSFIMVRQSMGRTLRLHPLKKFAQIIDYVDIFKKFNFDWGGPKRTNIAARHSSDRIKIYDDQKFPWTEKILHL